MAFPITIWAPPFKGAIDAIIACFGKQKKKEKKEEEDEGPAQPGIPLEVFGVAGAAGTTNISASASGPKTDLLGKAAEGTTTIESEVVVHRTLPASGSPPEAEVITHLKVTLPIGRLLPRPESRSRSPPPAPTRGA
ncbi:hypothetical protein PG985_003638 [Apiospora marii]|uniref:Uncharacterized protein n=1 Tax=Apiospora marii TaxID=335849 RepID=A0ABR1SHY6_9PEZI